MTFAHRTTRQRWADAVEKVRGIRATSNNRIIRVDTLNGAYAFGAHLESILLRHAYKIFFSTASANYGSRVAFHTPRKLVALRHHRQRSWRCHVGTANATHVRVIDRSHLGPCCCAHDGPGGRTRRRPRLSRISRQPRRKFCRRCKLTSAGGTGSITRSLGPTNRRRASDLHA